MLSLFIPCTACTKHAAVCGHDFVIEAPLASQCSFTGCTGHHPLPVRLRPRPLSQRASQRPGSALRAARQPGPLRDQLTPCLEQPRSHPCSHQPSPQHQLECRPGHPRPLSQPCLPAGRLCRHSSSSSSSSSPLTTSCSYPAAWIFLSAAAALQDGSGCSSPAPLGKLSGHFPSESSPPSADSALIAAICPTSAGACSRLQASSDPPARGFVR